MTTNQHSGSPSTTNRGAGNGLGIAALICGLLGLLGAFLIPLIGMVLGVVAAVLGGVGLSRARREGAGTGLPVTGLVLGILALVVAIGLVAVAVSGT